MVIPKDVSLYNKINSFGVIFIFIILVFELGVGIFSLTNTTYTTDEAVYDKYLDERKVDVNTPYVAYIKMFSKGYGPLMGILGGGFYCHNITLSIVRGSRNPENNVRDVFLGYFATFITYVVCGAAGYYGFLGSKFEKKLYPTDPDDPQGDI